MKKVCSILLMLTLVFTMFAFAGCGGSDSGSAAGDDTASAEPIKMTFSCGDSDDYYMVQYLHEWADKVSEYTDGQVEIEIISNGQTSIGDEAFEAMDMGTIQGYMDAFFAPAGVDATWNIFTMPYLFDDYDHQHRVFEEKWDEISDYLAEKTGVRSVGVFDGINRNTTLNVEVNKLADLKGVKIRVPEIDGFVETWKAFGASPVAIGFYEIYTSIQTGVVQGQENDVALSYSMGFHEVAPYVIMTQHCPYAGCIFMDEDYYQSLPENVREAMAKASEEIYAETVDYCTQLEADTLKAMEEDGATIIYPDLAEFREATKSVYDSLNDNAKHVKEIIDSAK